MHYVVLNSHNINILGVYTSMVDAIQEIKQSSIPNEHYKIYSGTSNVSGWTEVKEWFQHEEIVHVIGEEHWIDLLSSSKTIVVDFYADWCGPCKKIAPIFHELNKEYPNIIFAKVNVDKCKNITEKCKIRAMPTFQVWKNGKKIDELLGGNIPKLKDFVNHLM